MYILVVDTIHGGTEISRHLLLQGHRVDTVDVYRGDGSISVDEALKRTYDIIAAPVHLDPGHPLMQMTAQYRTHHQMTPFCLGKTCPRFTVEITGARGKTTTAHALASILPGSGILLSSVGITEFPSQTVLGKKSITPASTIVAAKMAIASGGWLIAEESLGVSGIGTLGILTSDEDYLCAGGKKHAAEIKKGMLLSCKTILAAPGISWEDERILHAEDIVSCEDAVCTWSYKGREGSFTNSLLCLTAYRNAIQTAAAAACILGYSPDLLRTFTALPGRLHATPVGSSVLIDDANSGTSQKTAIEAVRYGRTILPESPVHLVIGAEAENICEGFSLTDIKHVIETTEPDSVILVGSAYPDDTESQLSYPCVHLSTLAEGEEYAKTISHAGVIVLAVKTWR
ncbi:coenzyme F430 synthase [Methanogenium organophilum]|uniref:Coenzyme F430 synthase n=1 Tax=Methanogenium organophilum TaxID=2199 RepID=A0A9X9T7Y2_METOG|nr:coenzyme F430 synthase [Methanogenium organophilum]WAI01165.1 coenzyme F430 synthase [Methanogenium organophilum]